MFAGLDDKFQIAKKNVKDIFLQYVVSRYLTLFFERVIIQHLFSSFCYIC